MNSKIKELKRKNEDSKQKESKDINSYTKKCITSEMTKLDKMKLKIETSIKNHNQELEDKKKALEEVEKELKKLKELDKQCLV